VSEAVANPQSSTAGVSKGRWVLAVVVGVIVSVAVSVAFAAVFRGNAGVVAGLVVGSLATGVLVGARGVRTWINAAILTFAGQLLLGIAIAAVVLR
jgi:hypothetical protein